MSERQLEKLHHPTAPKHHWFERNLASGNLDYFLENFKNIIAQVQGNTHTIILSSEGIYNSWWDFSDESKKILSQLGVLFDLQVWVWFREPLEFIESYYKQCIRNPEVLGNPCYGKDLSLPQMLDIKWFSQHLDYHGFVQDCCAVFGEASIVVFRFETEVDIVQKVLTMLGLARQHDNPTLIQNQSLNNHSVSLLRVINQLGLSAKDKEKLMPHIKGINQVLSGYNQALLIDSESEQRIMQLYRPLSVFDFPDVNFDRSPSCKK